MKFKDKNIHDLIEKLKDQYQPFIHNQFINYYLLDSDIPKNDWLDVEDLIGSNKYYEAEGYDLNKLYDQILSFSSFLAKIKEEIFSVVEDFELEAAKTAKIFKGIPETLKKLKKMKMAIALCTISSEKTTNYILKRFHIEQFFDAVITRESVFEVKPHPTHLKAALNDLKVKSQEAVLVGDSVKDIECAIQLNVLAVGVTTGLSSIEELTCSGAHYIASSANDIPILIQQLNSKNSEYLSSV